MIGGILVWLVIWWNVLFWVTGDPIVATVIWAIIFLFGSGNDEVPS